MQRASEMHRQYHEHVQRSIYHRFIQANAPANHTWFGISLRQKHNVVAALRVMFPRILLCVVLGWFCVLWRSQLLYEFPLAATWLTVYRQLQMWDF